jgi:hypothetical protein
MSNENDDLNAKIFVDGEAVTLADLAGISMDDVQERRGEAFPKGVFVFEVEGGEDVPRLRAIGEGEKAKGGVIFALKCLDVIGVADPEFNSDPSTLIGKVHRETFFLSSGESLGYLKAFIKDIGAPYNPKLVEMLSTCAGVRFQAPIGKRKDKDDADKVYTNIVRQKIKPLAGAAVSEVAKAVA